MSLQGWAHRLQERGVWDVELQSEIVPLDVAKPTDTTSKNLLLVYIFYICSTISVKSIAFKAILRNFSQ